jgi:hypothetical protein
VANAPIGPPSDGESRRANGRCSIERRLRDALVAEATAHLDEAVENGRLTEAEAAERAADLTERITARVNGEHPARGEGDGSSDDA